MIRKIAITIDVLGLLYIISPFIIFCVAKTFFSGNDFGPISIVGGADGPFAIFLAAKFFGQGIVLLIIGSCILILNILALWRRHK